MRVSGVQGGIRRVLRGQGWRRARGNCIAIVDSTHWCFLAFCMSVCLDARERARRLVRLRRVLPHDTEACSALVRRRRVLPDKTEAFASLVRRRRVHLDETETYAALMRRRRVLPDDTEARALLVRRRRVFSDEKEAYVALVIQRRVLPDETERVLPDATEACAALVRQRRVLPGETERVPPGESDRCASSCSECSENKMGQVCVRSQHGLFLRVSLAHARACVGAGGPPPDARPTRDALCDRARLIDCFS